MSTETPATAAGPAYREEIAYDGRKVLRDSLGNPPPGDPHGPWEYRSTQIAIAHGAERCNGWQYRTTSPSPGVAFDPLQQPEGEGWEINNYMGADGHQSSQGEIVRTYWRRRIPGWVPR